MEIATIAIGIDLRLVPTEDGGRQTPLLGSHEADKRFTYRPNWGLPGWENGQQTAGPVLGFSESNIKPGERTRAVIVPLFVAEYPEWRDLSEGQVLRMYEGSRVCGLGEVRWIDNTKWFMPPDEADRLTAWLRET